MQRAGQNANMWIPCSVSFLEFQFHIMHAHSPHSCIHCFTMQQNLAAFLLMMPCKIRPAVCWRAANLAVCHYLCLVVLQWTVYKRDNGIHNAKWCGGNGLPYRKLHAVSDIYVNRLCCSNCRIKNELIQMVYIYAVFDIKCVRATLRSLKYPVYIYYTKMSTKKECNECTWSSA